MHLMKSVDRTLSSSREIHSKMGGVYPTFWVYPKLVNADEYKNNYKVYGYENSQTFSLSAVDGQWCGIERAETHGTRGLCGCAGNGWKTGLGEVAPLPGFSHESIEDVYPQLVEKLTFWKNGHGLIINLCIHRSLLVYLWRS